VSTRWARTALCSLAVAATLLLTSGLPTGGAGATVPVAPAPLPLTLLSQTPFVTPTAPWFNISLGTTLADSGLHASLTFYGRLDNSSQLQQATSATPTTGVLGRLPDIPFSTVTTTGVPTADVCVTVLPNANASAPSSGAGSCPSGSSTLTLGCTPYTGICGDVYPVSVALERTGASAPVARFTTFLTYEEPTAVGQGGALRVGVVVPVGAGGVTALAGALSDHRDVAISVAVSPAVVEQIEQQHTRDGLHALAELAALDNAEVLDEPYVPVNVAALSNARIPGEIDQQVGRGDQLLRSAGLKPSGGPWVDTTSSFAQGDAANLATGVQTAGSSELVLSDGDLTAAGVNNLTFAQPFTLDLSHGVSLPAAASDSSLNAAFTADPGDPVLAAEQLLGGLSFVHYENAFLTDARGVIVEPPTGWRPSAPFMEALLDGLTPGNYALKPVTLSQLFTQVPVGGNREPAVRHLQSGPASRDVSSTAADKIAVARQQLSSFTDAITGHPPEVTRLGDQLLETEARALNGGRRTAALAAYDRNFTSQTSQISFAIERTVTFTSRRAAIPITVLSSSPYPVSVVVTLTSDKFIFPNGNTRQLKLDRPTTSVRVTAQARGSGDRLPIDVTLRTANGQLVLARTVLTVHSTAISFVGIALTVLAGAVFLLWWVRTWRRSRRQRLRATADAPH
jgi:hypothetical protein